MPGERYRHIFLTGPTRTIGFTNPRKGGSSPRIPARDRAQHSAYLLQRLQVAWTAVDESRQAAIHVERHGAYIEFASDAGFDLLLKSLEDRGAGIHLLNVRREGEGSNERTFATVYVPLDKRGHFLRRINAFSAGKQPGKREYRDLVSGIADIQHAVLESFWQDSVELLPGDNAEWVETWLSGDDEGSIQRFYAILQHLNIEKAEGELKFPERIVCLIHANRSQLRELIATSDDLAEFRLGKELAPFYLELANADQIEVVRRLLSRTTFDRNPNTVVCILDHGVNNGHLMIQPVLNNADMHTVKPAWGVNDDDGHGTLMAGTVAYGDLLTILGSGAPVRISHRLESAKILPPHPDRNPKELWGFITAQGLSRAEIQAPNKKRIICMAVTAKTNRDRGRPSSWSGLVDELSSGYADGRKRLFVISAGNTEGSDNWRGYFDANLTSEVQDPAQAWNALTIGAFTSKVHLVDPTLQGYAAIAPPGGLSPYTTTSTTWSARKWPIKPEVLFEGGNIARGPNNSIIDADDLKLVSTCHDTTVQQFAPFAATSAATAQAAWMAARIQSLYPEAWPETVRALMVHTAEWTDAMRAQFLPAQPTKADYANLLRICGYGVPDLARALSCAANSLTLISQAELQPFDERGDKRVRITRDMHFYNLPWPREILEGLGSTSVRMRVTLSYFVEPGPGEIGWQDRYRYASHALRFAVNGPMEREIEFVSRVNNQAREEGAHPGTLGPGEKWLIGDARNVGSIHSDIWEGTAVELAASNLIAIYPAVGWWRERYYLGRLKNRCRYSLIVSIYPPTEEIEIYIPVAIELGVAVPIEISAL